jgi:hypothetical protein
MRLKFSFDLACCHKLYLRLLVCVYKENTTEQLLFAVRKGDLSAVEDCLDKRADKDARSEEVRVYL